jgi:hypothetical protein
LDLALPFSGTSRDLELKKNSWELKVTAKESIMQKQSFELQLSQNIF